jgi:hypothetical protein
MQWLAIFYLLQIRLSKWVTGKFVFLKELALIGPGEVSGAFLGLYPV